MWLIIWEWAAQRLAGRSEGPICWRRERFGNLIVEPRTTDSDRMTLPINWHIIQNSVGSPTPSLLDRAIILAPTPDLPRKISCEAIT